MLAWWLWHYCWENGSLRETIFHTWVSLDTDLMLKVSANLELFPSIPSWYAAY